MTGNCRGTTCNQLDGKSSTGNEKMKASAYNVTIWCIKASLDDTRRQSSCRRKTRASSRPTHPLRRQALTSENYIARSECGRYLGTLRRDLRALCSTVLDGQHCCSGCQSVGSLQLYRGCSHLSYKRIHSVFRKLMKNEVGTIRSWKLGSLLANSLYLVESHFNPLTPTVAIWG